MILDALKNFQQNITKNLAQTGSSILGKLKTFAETTDWEQAKKNAELLKKKQDAEEGKPVQFDTLQEAEKFREKYYEDKVDPLKMTISKPAVYGEAAVIENLEKGLFQLGEKAPQYAEKIAQEIEESPISAPGKFVFKTIAKGIGGVIGTPATMFGESLSAIKENRPVKAIADFVFGAVGGTYGGVIFNAIASQPAVEPVVETVFGGLEKGKEFVKKTPFFQYEKIKKFANQNLGVREQDFDDTFNVLADVAAFLLVKEGVKKVGGIKVGEKKIEVKPAEAFDAVREITTGNKGNARPEVVNILKEKISQAQAGGANIGEIVRKGFKEKVGGKSIAQFVVDEFNKSIEKVKTGEAGLGLQIKDVQKEFELNGNDPNYRKHVIEKAKEYFRDNDVLRLKSLIIDEAKRNFPEIETESEAYEAFDYMIEYNKEQAGIIRELRNETTGDIENDVNTQRLLGEAVATQLRGKGIFALKKALGDKGITIGDAKGASYQKALEYIENSDLDSLRDRLRKFIGNRTQAFEELVKTIQNFGEGHPDPDALWEKYVKPNLRGNISKRTKKVSQKTVANKKTPKTETVKVEEDLEPYVKKSIEKKFVMPDAFTETKEFQPVRELGEVKPIYQELKTQDGKLKAVESNMQDIPFDEVEKLITRKIKQSKEGKDFFNYAEQNLQDRDIRKPIFFERHKTLTAERAAEFLDGGIGGRVYNEMVKPVYESAEKMTIEGNKIKNEIEQFKVLEGSNEDINASLYAQKKITDVSEKSKKLAEYARDKYDEFLERLNEKREKLGLEPIQKRKDYITHLNELNILGEIFGSIEELTTKKRISELKSKLLDEHPNWDNARAFNSAKRQIEGQSGVELYIDAKSPIAKFVKQRLKEEDSNPSILRQLAAYTPNALRFIYQAENVAKNKAYKDALPTNAKKMFRLWNTEQVAGYTPKSGFTPETRRILSAIRNTLGANTILGNMATTAMQLTSFPQVIAQAGLKNTMVGVAKRIGSYLNDNVGMYKDQRTKALRSLETDIGFGNSLIDSLLLNIAKYDKARTPAVRTRQAINFGRNLLRGIMETADQFTTGATFEAFYTQGIKDGLSPEKAKERAEMMTGKTQANYFKEAIPPFLNTFGGKLIGQFGTYSMNQWEMLRKDFGKSFKFGEKEGKTSKNLFKQFTKFLIAAYLVDQISEKIFGRQPYEVKQVADEINKGLKGESNIGRIAEKAKDSLTSYIPYFQSAKYDTLPPTAEVGKVVMKQLFGNGYEKNKAIKDLADKWIPALALPYGENQIIKTSKAIDAIKGGDKNIKIDDLANQIKALLFGKYATDQAQEYFEKRDLKQTIREEQDITGGYDEFENYQKFKNLSDADKKGLQLSDLQKKQIEKWEFTEKNTDIKDPYEMGEKLGLKNKDGSPKKATAQFKSHQEKVQQLQGKDIEKEKKSIDLKASQLAQDIVKNQKFISATREKKRAFLMDALNAGDLNEEDIKFIASQINK